MDNVVDCICVVEEIEDQRFRGTCSGYPGGLVKLGLLLGPEVG